MQLKGDIMKKFFMCSIICSNGIVGGGLYLDKNAITFKTNKLTVDKQLRNLVLPLNRICEISWKRIIFPIATFKIIGGEQYKFLMFNKKAFENSYIEVKNLND